MKNKIPIVNFDRDTKYAKITVNPKIYSLQTIFAAAYVFLDKAYILLDYGQGKNIEVCLFAKNKQDDLRSLGLEFHNELLNYAHYFSRVEANAEIIKSIMQRTLFSVNPKFAEEAEEQEIQELLKELEKEKPAKPSRNQYARPYSEKKK